jgi:hypothetical protein
MGTPARNGFWTLFNGNRLKISWDSHSKRLKTYRLKKVILIFNLPSTYEKINLKLTHIVTRNIKVKKVYFINIF